MKVCCRFKRKISEIVWKKEVLSRVWAIKIKKIKKNKLYMNMGPGKKS